jgi:hypothetical protein
MIRDKEYSPGAGLFVIWARLFQSWLDHWLRGAREWKENQLVGGCAGRINSLW